MDAELTGKRVACPQLLRRPLTHTDVESLSLAHHVGECLHGLFQRERVLAEAYALSEREQGSLQVATFGYDQMPVNVDFRVNPSTGQVEPLGDQASGENAFRPLTAPTLRLR